jgi:hypothetical protein
MGFGHFKSLEEVAINFARYQVLLGNAGWPSSAWQELSKQSFVCRHYQAELGSEQNAKPTLNDASNGRFFLVPTLQRGNAYFLVPTLQRGNAYSTAPAVPLAEARVSKLAFPRRAWEREKNEKTRK